MRKHPNFIQCVEYVLKYPNTKIFISNLSHSMQNQPHGKNGQEKTL